MNTALSIEETLSLYCDLMHEIKVRIDAVERGITGKLPVHPLVAYESAVLQLRMICETIALACVVVHREAINRQNRHVFKAYEASKIIGALQTLHPRFYPQPSRQIRDKNGQVIEVEEIKHGFLKREDLCTLWQKSGDVLHRGRYKGLKLKLNDPKSFQPIRDSIAQIVTLLNHHQIALANSDNQIWCIMHEESSGKPNAFLMEFVGPVSLASS